MRIPGQTPLSSLAISPDQVRLLQSLWIESVEEAIALIAALSDKHQSSEAIALRALSTNNFAAAVPSNRLALLRRPQRGGLLGCLLDPQMVDIYRAEGRLRPSRPLPAGAFDDRLPPAVRLMDRLPPARDQGERGTCVAFATVALREFLLTPPEPLSEQFLYWGCKELDGSPDPGTALHTAMTVLQEYGVCQASAWPYNPMQSATEGQGPPRSDPQEKAKRYRLPSARTVEPGLVQNYKYVLAGENGQGGMPVTFGTLVFDSWYCSAETNRTGKITLPLPGEEIVGGHAMCAVGYVDDDTVPGGGYFIVRNSWGLGWAPDSPEAPGHALLPYDYIERFAVEAFTGPPSAPVKEVKMESPEPEWREFVRVLEREGRDLDRRLLKPGTRVLYHPRQPDVLREDTPENRQEFLRLNRAWTPELRASLWFPARADWPDRFVGDLARKQSASQKFFAAIEENLKTAVGAAFPDINLPTAASLLPWQSHIRRFTQESDLTDGLRHALLAQTGCPPDMKPPREWMAALSAVNSLRIYRIKSIPADIRIVAAFITPVKLQPDQPPSFARPDAATIQAVRDLVARQADTAAGRKPVYSFFTLGSALPWPEDIKGMAAGDHCILLSCFNNDDLWQTTTPPFFATRVSFRNFLDRMAPLTWQERVSTVKTVVDRRIADGYEANITVEKIAGETHYRKTTVRDAFLAMQEVSRDTYLVEQLKGGAIAIRRRRPGDQSKLTPASFHRGFLRRHFLLFVSAGVGVSGLALKSMINIGGVTGFLLIVFLVYGTGLVQAQINRRASEEKE
ncbi:MAG: C1 family peptidase [Thermodesulfobacteriota bacterium]